MSEETGGYLGGELPDRMIDPREFIKELAPDQLGVFEPLSGLMLLNISKADLIELSGRWSTGNPTPYDVEIIRTINHEAYHFAQVVGSGYVFHREARLLMVFNESAAVPQVQIEPEMQALLDAAREEAGDDPELLQRYEHLVAMLQGHNQFALFDQLAAPGDHSVMGALMPAFFAHLKELAESERIPNEEGLSILGVMEGSAVIHSHLLMHPDEDATPFIQAELETLPPVYRELWDLTIELVGDRALELALPAVTLALRYAAPHNAYLPLLARLSAAPVGEAVEQARALAEQLPELPDAGPPFGTALDLRRMHDGYRVYDAVLGSLAAGQWGIDSYDLLAVPAAMHSIGSFPLGIVTTDGYVGALDDAELAARAVLMGAVMRSQSRRRPERQFRQFQAEWARAVIGRMVGE